LICETVFLQKISAGIIVLFVHKKVFIGTSIQLLSKTNSSQLPVYN